MRTKNNIFANGGVRIRLGGPCLFWGGGWVLLHKKSLCHPVKAPNLKNHKTRFPPPHKTYMPMRGLSELPTSKASRTAAPERAIATPAGSGRLPASEGFENADSPAAARDRLFRSPPRNGASSGEGEGERGQDRGLQESCECVSRMAAQPNTWHQLSQASASTTARSAGSAAELGRPRSQSPCYIHMSLFIQTCMKML